MVVCLQSRHNILRNARIGKIASVLTQVIWFNPDRSYGLVNNK